jgi:hypothetical protein
MTPQIGNKHPRVISAINQAIQLNSDGRTASAVELLMGLALEFPEASAVHSYLAWFLLCEGRCGEAVAHSLRAAKLAPKSEKSSLIHFHVLWRNGQHHQALDEMKRFLAIRPSEEYANIIKNWEPKFGLD